MNPGESGNRAFLFRGGVRGVGERARRSPLTFTLSPPKTITTNNDQAYNMPCQGPTTVRAAKREQRETFHEEEENPEKKTPLFFVFLSLSLVVLPTFLSLQNQKTKYTQACQNQSNLVNFFLRAHYNVDTLTKPCKKLW